MKQFLLSGILLFCFVNRSPAQCQDSTIYKGLDQTAFQKIINSCDRYVLVHFKAEWCLVCKKEAPMLLKYQEENTARLKVIEIDLDQNPLLGHHYEIDALPFHLFFSAGEIKWNKIGMLNTKEVTELMKILDKKKYK